MKKCQLPICQMPILERIQPDFSNWQGIPIGNWQLVIGNWQFLIISLRQLFVAKTARRGEKPRRSQPAERLSAFGQGMERAGAINTAPVAMLGPYQRIIGMGLPAVPLNLEELQQEPHQWFWALEASPKKTPFHRKRPARSPHGPGLDRLGKTTRLSLRMIPRNLFPPHGYFTSSNRKFIKAYCRQSR